MNRKEVLEKLSDIFREVFDRSDISLTDETKAGDVEGWDSLVYITIISIVEESFSIRLSRKKVLDLKNVGELVDIIQEKVR